MHLYVQTQVFMTTYQVLLFGTPLVSCPWPYACVFRHLRVHLIRHGRSLIFDSTLYATYILHETCSSN